MWVQWSEQREYMDISWGCGWFLATMFVVINLVGQLGAVAMVLTRYQGGYCMRSVVLHRRPADHRLQYSLGSSVLVQEFGPDWSIVVGVGRV